MPVQQKLEKEKRIKEKLVKGKQYDSNVSPDTYVYGLHTHVKISDWIKNKKWSGAYRDLVIRIQRFDGNHPGLYHGWFCSLNDFVFLAHLPLSLPDCLCLA